MNRWIDSGPMKVMETSAMKKYQRGRKGIVMLETKRIGEAGLVSRRHAAVVVVKSMTSLSVRWPTQTFQRLQE
jgi:hypothetical protein